MKTNPIRPNRFQFSLSAAFALTTAVAAIATVQLILSKVDPNETTFIVFSICLLFIPFLLAVFVLSATILVSLFALLRTIFRATTKNRSETI